MQENGGGIDAQTASTLLQVLYNTWWSDQTPHSLMTGQLNGKSANYFNSFGEYFFRIKLSQPIISCFFSVFFIYKLYNH